MTINAKSLPLSPLPPKTLLRLIKLWPHARKQGREIGQLYRVGYYSRRDGLGIVWLVDAEGRYNWTAELPFIHQYFEIVGKSNERSWYGSKRPLLGKLVLGSTE